MYSLLLLAAVGANLVTAAIPVLPGYTLTWSDDFDGINSDAPNASDWIMDVGTSYPGGAASWGTGEIQTYTTQPGNVGLTGDGRLAITAVRDSAGAWTSGRVETQRMDFAAAPGGKMRIQASLAMPAVVGVDAIGYWPAFWALGSDFRGNYQNWPGIGELDIMENVNGVDRVWGTFHCGTNPGGPCIETTGLGNNATCVGTSCLGNMHTYAVEVDRSVTPEEVRWLVDDVVYHRVTSDIPGLAPWAAAVDHGFFIIFNLAMGGQFPDNQYGSPTPLLTTLSGGVLFVDYVAVYNA
ncbi:glycosyl hydrolase family 16 protein [Coleophoma cylindrospora]|uniref:Glycosyl hydrolase family 16 protein n=1 Tax=Coleophoma cylindrospora TaxID=1849047 RepID=A0A3D8Q6Q0_9HELO|nr:glycosyl hydrolase family 16 protein [Coleophoma cylindrospora]